MFKFDGDNLHVARMHLTIVVRAPRTLIGAIAMGFWYLAQKLGAEAIPEVVNTKSDDFTKLPQKMQDRIVADMMASADRDTMEALGIVSVHGPTLDVLDDNMAEEDDEDEDEEERR